VNPWVLVVIAGLMETGWAIGLKYTAGFTRIVPSVLTTGGALLSFYLLSVAMKDIPVGTAYAVWVGIGATGTAIVAVFLFGEPVTPWRVAGVGLIVAGIITLKFA
jgi:quaternary ammonium compound-resistance protein SugE